MKHAGIVFMLLGLVCSIVVIHGGDRGIVIDSIASDLGVDVWELAFFTYLSFMVAGLIVSMLTTKKYQVDDITESVVGMVILLLFSMFILENLAVGTLATEITAMRDEFYEWWLIYAGMLAVEVTHLMMLKGGKF
jgi:hypothetical protein